MKLGRSFRVAVALLTAALLLLCQSAYAARACQIPAAAGVAAGAPPCHLANEGNTPRGSSPSPCELAQAVGDAYKPVVAASAALYDAILPARPPARVVESSARPCATGVSGVPPPPRLLHCRLLI